jgi:hypothetical protein
MADIYSRWVEVVCNGSREETAAAEAKLRSEITRLQADSAEDVDAEKLQRRIAELELEVDSFQQQAAALQSQVATAQAAQLEAALAQIDDLVKTHHREVSWEQIRAAKELLPTVDFTRTPAQLRLQLAESEVPQQRRRALLDRCVEASALLHSLDERLRQSEEKRRHCAEHRALIEELEKKLRQDHDVRQNVFQSWQDLPEPASQRLVQEWKQEIGDAEAERSWAVDATLCTDLRR